jgi:hypothetical protein
MKNFFCRILSVAAILATTSMAVSAQAFEGMIEFKKASTTDTTNYIYYVKGNQVRIDEIGTKSKTLAGTFLVDMDAKTMKSLNYERKLYMDQPTPSAPVIKGQCIVKKGQNVKNIQGYKCVEWIVTNNEEATIITYYVADGKFTFFEKLLRQLNRKDKASTYYLQLKDIKNSFPMLSVQTDLSGKETGRLEVTKVTKKEIDPAMFEMPKGFNKFER